MTIPKQAAKQAARLAAIVGLALAFAVAAHAQTGAPSPTGPAPTATTSFGAAPTATPTPSDRYSFRATMLYGSAFIRLAPSVEAEAAASIFEDNIVEVVGRNLDGTWYEVRRPGRAYTLGWLLAEFLDIDEGAPELLPLTDRTTGLTGPQAVTGAAEAATYAIDNLVLRDSPLTRTGRQIGRIPAGAVVPVVYRNYGGTWLLVNYLGTLGWVATFNTRPAPSALVVPVAPGLPREAEVVFEQISPEEQRAQVARLRAYLNVTRDLAVGLEYLWGQVVLRQIMPCEAPAYVRDYPYTDADTRQFPELGRYLPRLDAVGAQVNTAIEPLTRCGVFDVEVAIRARDSATNAKVNIDATLGALLLVEDRIRD